MRLPPEVRLSLDLRTDNGGLRSRRQHPAGRYVLDFCCAPARLAVEVDDEAHSRGDRPLHDEERDVWLAAQSVRIIRYSAGEVTENLEGVVRQIVAVAIERSQRLRRRSPPSPSVALTRATSPWRGRMSDQ